MEPEMEDVNPYQSVYVVWARRTPSGCFYGQFNDYSAPMLGAAVIRCCLDDLNLRSRQISQVILGQVASSGFGRNPTGRTASLAEIPSIVPTSTVNMGCASGLKAVLKGYEAVKFGPSKLVICGGQENLTMAPQSMYVPPGVASQSNLPLHTTMVVEDLSNQFTGIEMRERANQLAEHYNISREVLDKYALDSVQKATQAMEKSYFNNEIIIVRGCSRDETLLKRIPATLGMLMHEPTLIKGTPEKPSTITEANSAPLSDGAAAVMLCNGLQLPALRKNPLAKIIKFAEVILSPDNYGIGSAVSIRKILDTTGWSKDSVDLFEIQEVFAVQVLVVIEKLQLDPRKVNISGGAIALGHAVGASSTRMLITLIHNLRRLNLKRGIASVCTGQGMALAVAVETVDPKQQYFF